MVQSYTALSTGSRARMAGVGRPLYKTGKGVRLASWSTFFFLALFPICTHRHSLDWYLMKDLHPPLDKYSTQVELKNVKT